jgi:hypothetical protein
MNQLLSIQGESHVQELQPLRRKVWGCWVFCLLLFLFKK